MAASCPLCGGPLGKSLLTITVPDRFERAAGISSDGYSREWQHCEQCDAAIDRLPETSRFKLAALATNYYDIDLGKRRLAERFDKICHLSAKESDNKNRVLRIRSWLNALPQVNRQRRVLDVGAGLGVFLYEFLDDYWSGVGVEPDEHAAAHLRSLNRFAVEEGLFDGTRDFGKFDLITLNKVIEHVERPHRLLTDCLAAVASPLGFVYIEVPDAETIGRRPPADNILGPLHWHLQTPKSLNRLLQDLGFHVLHLTRAYEPSGKISLCALATDSCGREFLANHQ